MFISTEERKATIEGVHLVCSQIQMHYRSLARWGCYSHSRLTPQPCLDAANGLAGRVKMAGLIKYFSSTKAVRGDFDK